MPQGEQWASKSSAHRWLKRWQADGTLSLVEQRIINIAQEHGIIPANVPGEDSPGTFAGIMEPSMALFPPGKGGGEGISYGGKGKGVLIHLITEGNGIPISCCTTPANGNERQQVLPLLDKIKVKTSPVGRPKKRFRVLAADKGYDAKWLRQTLRRRGTRGQIAKRQWRGKKGSISLMQ